MKLLSVLSAALALGCSLAAAATIEGKLTNGTALEHDTAARLASYNDFEATVLIQADQSFKFEAIPAGEYVLKIRDRVNKYLAYHVQVPEAEGATPIVTLWQPAVGKIPGGIIPGWPMTLPSQGVWIYENAPPKFDLLRLIKGNPLILLLGVGVLITFGGPALMAQLDPEGFKEVNDRSAGMHKSLANFQNVDATASLSKYLAGAVDSQSEVKEVQAQASATGVQTGGGGGGGGGGGTPGKKGKKRK